MDDGRRAYEVRYGWNAPTVKGALLCLLLLGLAFVPGSPGWVAAALGLVGTVSFLATALLACSHRVALRVDPEGVTLGGTPFGIRTERMSWPEVVSIDLWTEQSHRMVKTPYIGVRHRKGSVPPPEARASPDSGNSTNTWLRGFPPSSWKHSAEPSWRAAQWLCGAWTVPG